VRLMGHKLITTAHPFAVIGIGPGESPYRLPLADEEVEKADLLMGGDRHLALFRSLGKEEISLAGRMKELPELLCREGATKRVALLVSGDPGYHSPLKVIASQFDRSSYQVVPGLSSFQLAAARSGAPWQEDFLFSLHGQEKAGWEGRILTALEEGRRVILLTDIKRNPRFIGGKLLQTTSPGGLSDDIILELYYRLGCSDERSEIIGLKDFLVRSVDKEEKEALCIMIIRRS
jgi:precorrin-6y C5,15-methyltransferase (decarboxylating) CbiE subunit